MAAKKRMKLFAASDRPVIVGVRPAALNKLNSVRNADISWPDKGSNPFMVLPRWRSGGAAAVARSDGHGGHAQSH